MFSFVVEDEKCPSCGQDLTGQDALRFQIKGTPVWAVGSANPPCGAVTEDEVDTEYPDEGADLILYTDAVAVSCIRCATPIPFRAVTEE
jgi:hypothetical protein